MSLHQTWFGGMVDKFTGPSAINHLIWDTTSPFPESVCQPSDLKRCGSPSTKPKTEHQFGQGKISQWNIFI
jgi:hypothetical protein